MIETLEEDIEALEKKLKAIEDYIWVMLDDKSLEWSSIYGLIHDCDYKESPRHHAEALAEKRKQLKLF
jgi:hypothetical protein